MMRRSKTGGKRIAALVVAAAMILSMSGCRPSKNGDDFEAYYAPLTAADVATEEDVSFAAANLLLTAASDASYKDVKKLVKKNGAQIVGYISETGDYQIRFDAPKTLAELQTLAEQFMADPLIAEAMVEYAALYSSDAVDYKSDPWVDPDRASDDSGSTWNVDRPRGSNWWAEAIGMPTVWDRDVQWKPVKVGIMDTMFDLDNDDLDEGVFAKTWNNPANEDGSCNVSQLYNEALEEQKQAKLSGDKQRIEAAQGPVSVTSHGTHVAGIIAAQAGNGFGITGINPHATLYGYAMSSEEAGASKDAQWGTLFQTKCVLAQLLNEGVKVINISMGLDDALIGTSDGDPSWTEFTQKNSKALEEFLLKYIDSGKQFLIVKATGNESTKDNKLDVSNDLYGAITNEKAASRILFVGAADIHPSCEYYPIAEFSNTGDNVVYAPGVDVLSDVPSDQVKMKKGTSMATPIVSGLASLIWSINPNLTAEQVRSFIYASTGVNAFNLDDEMDIVREMAIAVNGEPAAIVNADVCVQLALATAAEEKTEAEYGTVNGMVYAKPIGDEKDYLELEIESLSLCDASGKELSKVALQDISQAFEDEKGNVEYLRTLKSYSLVTTPGTYILKAAPKGYDPIEKTITVEPNAVLTEDFQFVNWDDLVTDALRKTHDDSVVAIPKINLKAGDCESINDEIWENLYERYEQSLETSALNGSYMGIHSDYQWHIRDNMLSLLVEQGNNVYAGTYYMVYNVSLPDGKQLSADEVIAAAGLTQEEYTQKAKEAAGSLFWDNNGHIPEENFYNEGFVSFFNGQLQRTIADENIEAAQPYFNEDGQLCISIYVYSMAGAEKYANTINLEDYQLNPDYEKGAELRTYEVNISQDEAYDKACEFWDYTPGKIASETGFEMFVVAEYGGEVQKDASQHPYYSFLLRWRVVSPEGDSWMSTIDFLKISAVSGEVMDR